MSILEIFRLIFGSVFIFLPGLAWSYVFFEKKSIDWVERIALSFGLSIVLVPLSVFWLNLLFGLGITLLSISLVVFGLTAIAFVCPLGQKHPLWVGVLDQIRSWLKMERWSLTSATSLSRTNGLRRLPKTSIFTRAKLWFKLDRWSLKVQKHHKA